MTVPTFFSPLNFGSARNLGPAAFYTLVGTAFLLCCAASLLTADVISRERREGTLGLLLLTRVRGFDVLLGKLTSAGIVSLGGLVALLPVLMIPILAGGITGGEVLRETGALLNTLFFALSLGLWASASQTDRARATRATIVTFAAVSFIPLACFVVPTYPMVASPLMTIFAATDRAYRGNSAVYWASLAIVQLISWLFLRNAARKMRRSRGDDDAGTQSEPAPTVRPSLPSSPRSMDPQLTLPFPTALPASRWRSSTSMSPVEWLVRRQRGMTLLLWIGAVTSLFHYFTYLLYRPFMGFSAWAIISSLPSLAISILAGACFAFVASRFFMEARRSGELELLLSTPMGAERIIMDQWKALERLMVGPALFLICIGLLRLLPLVTSINNSPGIPAYTLIAAGMALVNTVAGLGAICWVGLWFGLKARSQAAAVVWTAGLAKSLPYLFGIILSLLLRFVFPAPLGNPNGIASAIVVLLPSVAVFFSYWGLIVAARGRLRLELAGAEL